MRVWRVEEFDYNEPTHKGTFIDPSTAADTFIESVGSCRVAESYDVEIEIRNVESDGRVVLTVGYGDTVTLTGERVIGRGHNPARDNDDLRQLFGVFNRLRQTLGNKGFKVEDYQTDGMTPWGKWELSR